MEITFLGTATSTGVPVIGCDCSVCQSTNPKNNRLRSSIHVRAEDLSWVVDTGPDFRTQCLRENLKELDAVLYTHAHMDHIVGFDDLRRFSYGEEETISIYARPSCLADLERMFTYAFNGKNAYIAYVKPDPRPIQGPFQLGLTKVTPIEVAHGKVETIGFLFEKQNGKRAAYIPDCKIIAEADLPKLKGLEILILDALRFREHPTHLNFSEALDVICNLKPHQAWLTHFSCDVDHDKAEMNLPRGVNMAYDGLKLTL